MQIDQFGNVNLAYIGDHEKPLFRGPGIAGGNATNFARRTFVWVSEHTLRVFVDRVDFVCAAGYGDVDPEHWKMTRLGLSPIVTPLCVMRMDPSLGRVVLVSRHPGVSADEIASKTGFQFGKNRPPRPRRRAIKSSRSCAKKWIRWAFFEERRHERDHVRGNFVARSPGGHQVIDFGHAAAGPYCAQLLVELAPR